MSLKRPSVDKISHELVRKYTSEPLKFAYYEHFVATPPMRQSRRASVVNRLLLILIIAISLFILFHRKQTYTHFDQTCVQDEWTESPSKENTEDLGSTYRITFADVQKTFKWVSLPELKDAEFLMLVASNSDDLARRNVLRRTWMSAEKSRVMSEGRMKALFLVGSGGETVDKIVMEEAKLYGDMVIADFKDDYLALPFKSLSMLLYAVSKSPSTRLIGKIDQDVLFFPDQLDHLIRKGTINVTSSSVYGKLYEDGVLVNQGEEGQKWQVSKKSYKCPMYPSYLSGPFYLTTRRAAERILNATKHRKLISVEDVLITGLLAGDVGVEKVDLPFLYNTAGATSDRQKNEILSWHTDKNNEKYVESFESFRQTRCNPCLRPLTTVTRHSELKA